MFRLDLQITTSSGSNFCYLGKIQLNWSLSAKYVDQDFDFELFLVDLDDLALKIREWAFFDPHTFVEFVEKARLNLSLGFIAFLLDGEEIIDLFASQWRWFTPWTSESCDPRRISNHVVNVIVPAATD